MVSPSSSSSDYMIFLDLLGDRNGTETIYIHKANRVGIELPSIKIKKGSSSLNINGIELLPIHQRKEITSFNNLQMDLLPIHERKLGTTLNNNQVDSIDGKDNSTSLNKHGVNREEGTPLNREGMQHLYNQMRTETNSSFTDGNVSEGATSIINGAIELLPINGKKEHINQSALLNSKEMELISINDKHEGTFVHNDGIVRDRTTLLSNGGMELLPIHARKEGTSVGKHSVRKSAGNSSKMEGIELHPIHESKLNSDIKRSTLSNVEGLELPSIQAMNNGKAVCMAALVESRRTHNTEGMKLLPINEQKKTATVHKDEIKSELSTSLNKQIMELLSIHDETSYKDEVSEKALSKEELQPISHHGRKKGTSSDVKRMGRKDGTSLNKDGVVQVPFNDHHIHGTGIESKVSTSVRNGTMDLLPIQKRKGEGISFKDEFETKRTNSSNEGLKPLPVHDMRGGKSPRKCEIENKGDALLMKERTEHQSIRKRIKHKLNKVETERKRGTSLNFDGMELLPIHQRKSNTSLNKDGMELHPIHQVKMPFSKDFNESDQCTAINEGTIELLPICGRMVHTSVEVNVRGNENVLSSHDDTELLYVKRGKGATSLNSDGMELLGRNATLQANETGGNEDCSLNHNGMDLLAFHQSKETASLLGYETNGIKENPSMKGGIEPKANNSLIQDTIEREWGTLHPCLPNDFFDEDILRQSEFEFEPISVFGNTFEVKTAKDMHTLETVAPRIGALDVYHDRSSQAEMTQINRYVCNIIKLIT